MHLDILNRKETKRVMQALIDTYGFDGELEGVFLRKRDDKLYLVSPDFTRIDDKMLRIDTMGLYFGTFDEKGLRLTIDGSQLIGPQATKGVMDLAKAQADRWLKGEDVQVDSPDKGFLIVRSGKDYMGSGRMRDGMLLNFVPKTRRVASSFP